MTGFQRIPGNADAGFLRVPDGSGGLDEFIDAANAAIAANEATLQSAIGALAGFNVKLAPYNAVGDDTANDTAAIQAAIDAAYAAGGGTVYLPPGSYRVTQLAKTWTSGVTVNIVGAGKRATKIKKFGAGTIPLVSFIGTPDPTSSYSDICALSIEGAGNHDGIKLDALARLKLAGVYITGCDKAIHNLGALVMALRDVTIIDNVDGLYNRVSAQVGATPPNLITLYDTQVISNSHRGIDHGSGQMLVLGAGCDVEFNGTAADQTTGGLYVQNTVDDAIGFAPIVVGPGAWFESNFGWSIQANAGDLLIARTLILGSESGRAVKGRNLRRLVLDEVMAPSVGDLVDADATVGYGRIVGGVIHTLSSFAPTRKRLDEVSNSAGLMEGFQAPLGTWEGNSIFLKWANGGGVHELRPNTGTGELEFRPHSTTAEKHVNAVKFDKEIILPTAISVAGASNNAIIHDDGTDEFVYKDNAGNVSSLKTTRRVVRVCAVTDINKAAPGPTIDGIAMAALDRVLLAGQTLPAQNGPWVWNGAAVAMTRALDANTADKLTDPTPISVDEGASQRDTIWSLTSNKPITVDTTPLRYTRIHPSYDSASHPIGGAYQPANSKLENLPRDTVPLTAQTGLTTQIVRVFPLGVLRAGDSLAAINFQVSLAAAAVTNSWAGIARLSDLKILAISASSAAAPAINTVKTFPFGAAFLADKDEVLIGFVMYQATTVPGFYGILHGNAVIVGEVPIVNGTSSTGQTTPPAVGATLAALTAQPQMYYAFAT